MVSLEQVRTYMRKAAQNDSATKYVNVSAETLEEALREASLELSLPIKKIEYEVLEKGSGGVLGFGKRPFLIVAYPAGTSGDVEESGGEFDLDFGFEQEKEADVDGRALVRLTPNGVMLKITPPVGEGVRATERDAMNALTRRTRERVDTSLVSKAVKRADDQWVKVADFAYNPANDAYVKCDIVDGEMKAIITMSPPGDGGVDPTADTIRTIMETAGVIHGINEERLLEIEENPTYREPLVAAEGTRPENGADAEMVFNFRTDSQSLQLRQTKDGKVDFKELNRIENVVEGQVLAKKRPAGKGVPGQTVTGRLLPARDGKDIEPPLGANTRLSDNGMSVLAEKNGLVKLVNGKITVDEIHIIDGDLTMREGNTHFVGTVIIKGSVEDGFSVNAGGDIEVVGSVGKSDLEAARDIIVHQGIAGKGEGKIRAGGSIWSKFLENANVDAQDMVVVSDGIINSQVVSGKRVICRGKRASIVGGHIRASEEVDAKTLGSLNGMETIVEVGFDPKSRERLIELEELDAEAAKRIEEIALNMSTIENMRKNRRKISPDKLKQYSLMKKEREIKLRERQKYQHDIHAIQEYLDELKTAGRISVSGTVYPGVKVSIKDAQLTVRHETRAVTYLAESGQVKVTKYEESRADIALPRGERS